MAWYTAGGIWRRRAPISVDLGATGTTVDVDVTIPREWDHFWTQIDSSGNELRVTTADGRTLLSYSVDNGSGGAFSKTNRQGRIRIDGVTVVNLTACQCLWLYYDSTSNQGSAAVVTTITAARNGYIELSSPRGYIFSHLPQRVDATRPRQTMHKTTNQVDHVWIRYDHVLAKAFTAQNSSAAWEEPLYATYQVLNTSGADQSGMRDATQTRWVWWRERLWLRLLIQAGTTATNYTLYSGVRTVEPGGTAALRTIETIIGVQVRDTRHTS